mgnify:CR=1 FL=1
MTCEYEIRPAHFVRTVLICMIVVFDFEIQPKQRLQQNIDYFVSKKDILIIFVLIIVCLSIA